MNEKSSRQQVRSRINELPKDAVMVPSDFTDIASPDTIRQVLKKEFDEGRIDRVMRGVYYKPKFNKLLEVKVPANVDDVARAIARARNWNIVPNGEAALNSLGLSTQVPASYHYASDGPYAKIDVNGTPVHFKHTRNRDISSSSSTTLLVVAALKALGQNNVDSKAIKKIARRLSLEEKQDLMDETTRASEWIREAIIKIYNNEEVRR